VKKERQRRGARQGERRKEVQRASGKTKAGLTIAQNNEFDYPGSKFSGPVETHIVDCVTCFPH